MWIGGPQEEGSQGAVLPLPDRARRVQGAPAPHRARGLLGAEVASSPRSRTSTEMQRTARELGPRLRDRRGRRRARRARARLPRLAARRQLHLPGHACVPRRPRRPAATACRRARPACSRTASLLPVVFPGPHGGGRGPPHALAPNDPRIVDIDYCNNASAIYHLEPHRRHRDPRVGRRRASCVEATLLLGRLAKGAFTQKAADIPLLKEKHDWLLANSGAAPNIVRLPRDPRPLQPLPQARAVLRQRARPEGHHRPHRLHVRATTRSPCTRAGARATWRSPSPSRACATRTRSSRTCAQALADEFGPITFSTSADLGAVSLLLFYFDSSRLEQPLEPERGRAASSRACVTTWEDRVVAALEEAFGEREGRQPLPTATYAREPQRPLPRGDAARGGAGGRPAPRAAGGPPRGRASSRARAETATLKLYSRAAARRSPRPCARCRTSASRSPRSCASRWPCPRAGAGFLYRFEIEATAERIASLVAERGALRRRPARPRRGAGHRRPAQRPRPARRAWPGARSRSCARCATTCCRSAPHYNAETVNGVLLRNSAVAAALFRSFAARFDPARRRATARRPWPRPTPA